MGDQQREAAELLEGALERSLRHAPVDTGRLLEGAHAGAGRIRRRRRRAGAAAVTLVTAGAIAGVGWGLRPLDPVVVPADPTVSSLPAPTTSSPTSPSLSPTTPTSLPTASGPAPTGAGAPSPSLTRGPATPTQSAGSPSSSVPTSTPPSRTALPAPEVDPDSLPISQSAFDLPTQLLPPGSPAPASLPVLDPPSRYRGIPAVMGQACDPRGPGTPPIAGVSGMWARDMTSVDVNVTAYSRGKGRTAFAELRADTGYCVFGEAPGFANRPTSAGDEAVSRSGAEESQTVIRVGDVLVGVRAWNTGSDAAIAQETAERVAAYLVQQGTQGTVS